MKKISKITAIDRGKSFRITFEDGTFLPLEEDSLVRFNIYKGKELEEEEIAEIIYNNDLANAKSAAFSYLSRRRTSGEVKNYLKNREYSPEVIEDLIFKLKDLNLLDDEQYAKDFTRDKIHLKKDGPNKIRYLLKRKGMSDTVIEEVLGEIPVETWIRCSEELLLKKFKKCEYTGPKEFNKMQRYLYGKGYDTEVIRKVIRSE